MSFDELSFSNSEPADVHADPPPGDHPLDASADGLRRSIRRLREPQSRASLERSIADYERRFTLHHASDLDDPIESSDDEPDLRNMSTAVPPSSYSTKSGKSLPLVIARHRPIVISSDSEDELSLELPSTGQRRDTSPVRSKHPQRQNATVGTDGDVQPVRNPHGQAPPKPNSMASDWCYTLNSPTRDDVARLRRACESDTPKVVYHVFQLERGAAGNLHCQGFICFANRYRMSTVKTLLGKSVHLEIRKGTPQQAADYCRDPSKRDPRHAGFLYEFGDLPVSAGGGQGGRSDLAKVQALLDSHVPMATVAREHFNTWCKSYKAFDRYVTEFVSEPRKEKSLFFCFTGESGTGKSKAAYSFLHAFTVPPGSSGVAWFDGYDATRHVTVLFDEFSGSRCSWTELLRLTDKYPHTVNTKGSQVQFNPKALVFTSNSEPEDWYPNIPEKLPLLRRIDSHWQYFRRDTKALSPDILQIVQASEVERKEPFHAICCCKVGDPTYHPLVQTYEHLLVDKSGTTWFGIPVDKIIAPTPVQGLW